MYKWYIAIGLNLLQVFPSVPPFVFVQWCYLLYTVFSCLVAVPTVRLRDSAPFSCSV